MTSNSTRGGSPLSATGIHRAPVFTIPPRDVVAVEHPMIVKNIDKALETFGRGQFKRILETDDIEACIPLYLHPSDAMCGPILSTSTRTNNLLLKITVPKRTGRKRKRGSHDPYTEDGKATSLDNGDGPCISVDHVSHSRLDRPGKLLRTLKDNSSNYKIEPVAEIDLTHRFRGLADFQQTTAPGSFAQKFTDLVVPGDLESIKKFAFDPSRGWKENEEIPIPPKFTDHPIPFNWAYHQNVNLDVVYDSTGTPSLINKTKSARLDAQNIFSSSLEIPTSCPFSPPDDPLFLNLLASIRKVLAIRPIWTRRSLLNEFADAPGLYMIKSALPFLTYQFRNGPFRDAIIKFGLDPRTDPKYRIYQTLFFQMYRQENDGGPWQDMRSEYQKSVRGKKTHLFDGKTLELDGKVWQLCDITDPFLSRVISAAKLRSEFDPVADGWYCNGSWAKIKAIMKTKIIALQAGKRVPDALFDELLEAPDHHEGKTSSCIITVMPDLRTIGVHPAKVKRRKEAGEGDEGLKRKRKRRYRKRNIQMMRSLTSQNPETVRNIDRRSSGNEFIFTGARAEAEAAAVDSRAQVAVNALSAMGTLDFPAFPNAGIEEEMERRVRFSNPDEDSGSRTPEHIADVLASLENGDDSHGSSDDESRSDLEDDSDGDGPM